MLVDNLLALGRYAEFARQLEQVQRFLERDRVHFLPRAQAGETRFFLVVAGADLHEGSVAPHAHRNRLAGFFVGAELARLDRLVAADVFHLVVDLGLERGPEIFHQRQPVGFAARNLVERSSSSCAVKS